MTPTFTDRQLDIMNILWNRGSATVREAKEELDEDLAYTSVLTVFQTLQRNGHVRHESEGKRRFRERRRGVRPLPTSSTASTGALRRR